MSECMQNTRVGMLETILDVIEESEMRFNYGEISRDDFLSIVEGEMMDYRILKVGSNDVCGND